MKIVFQPTKETILVSIITSEVIEVHRLLLQDILYIATTSTQIWVTRKKELNRGPVLVICALIVHNYLKISGTRWWNSHNCCLKIVSKMRHKVMSIMLFCSMSKQMSHFGMKINQRSPCGGLKILKCHSESSSAVFLVSPTYLFTSPNFKVCA